MSAIPSLRQRPPTEFAPDYSDDEANDVFSVLCDRLHRQLKSTFDSMQTIVDQTASVETHQSARLLLQSYQCIRSSIDQSNVNDPNLSRLLTANRFVVEANSVCLILRTDMNVELESFLDARSRVLHNIDGLQLDTKDQLVDLKKRIFSMKF
ncbi:hypothetical protein M3Y94_00919500 [Aphelenchoides besseyi]|nr:hypothetical protein M3Y94_00919500 [Aphelenchoides besseyi]